MKTIFAQGFLLLSLLWSSAAATAANRVDALQESMWQGVIAPSDIEPRRADETTWHAFQRQVEVTARLRRERGLQFWQKYPDDPRRFSWLVLTVHLAPQYPAEIESFATRGPLSLERIGGRDEIALSAWRQVYPRLREEFWSNPQVSNAQRRFLVCGEIHAKLHEAMELQDDRIPLILQATVEEIGDYAQTYSAPLSHEDRSQHLVLLMLMLKSLHEKAIMAHCSAAVETKIEHLNVSAGGDAVRKAWADMKTQMTQNSASMPDDPWARLPGFPHDQVTNFEERLVFWHKYAVYARSIREMGLALWTQSSSPHGGAIDWFADTNHTAWSYFANFGEAIWQLSEQREEELRLDEDAISEWGLLRRSIRDALLKLPLSNDDRMRVARGEIDGRARELAGGYRGRDAYTAAIDVVRDSLGFYLEMRNFIAGLRTLDLAVRSARTVGVKHTTVREILSAHLQRLDPTIDPRWKTFVEGEVRRLDAFIDRKPLEITLTRTDGTTFDLESLRGKLVLVDFWSTGCGACLTMMRKFAPVYRKYREAGFEIVSVNLDDDPKQAENVARIEAEFPWTQVRGNYESIMDRFSFIGVPQFMFLNREGMPVAESSELQSARELERNIRLRLSRTSGSLQFATER